MYIVGRTSPTKIKAAEHQKFQNYAFWENLMFKFIMYYPIILAWNNRGYDCITLCNNHESNRYKSMNTITTWTWWPDSRINYASRDLRICLIWISPSFPCILRRDKIPRRNQMAVYEKHTEVISALNHAGYL